MDSNKPKKVLLGLSGGVDSSVAALLLKNKGYKVICAFMKNFSDTKDPLTNRCSWKNERDMAIKVAYQLDLEFMTLDFEKEYKKLVIEPMISDYKKGKTPNPDILCNSIIKFPLLWKAAKKIGADLIATGHYARIKKTSKGFFLLKSMDREKDQTYFLSDLTQEDLSHTIFPIGDLTKNEVRKLAKENNLPNHDKPGTKGVCFVGNIDFHDFLKEKIKKKQGKIISPEGRLIGFHPGAMYFTIGQKIKDSLGMYIHKPKELAQKRLYVIEKRRGNILVAAPEGHPSLFKKEVNLTNIHLIDPKEKPFGKIIDARIRHRGDLIKGQLIKNKKILKFVFKKPVTSLAEGQFLVFYKKDRVIGCSEIA